MDPALTRRDWTERGNVGGQPEALTDHSANGYYAADGSVLVSTDGGATFGPMISQ